MFAIPTLADLVLRARNALRANIPGSDAWGPLNNLAPTAKVFGGLMYELFGRLDWVADQAFISSASPPYLQRHGAQYGLAQKPAQLALGIVSITAADSIAVPAGATFQRADGVVFVASFAGSSLSLSGAGVLPVPVVAFAAGADANTAPGAPLTILATLSGAGAPTATAAVDSSGITGGTDLEDIEQFRAEILFRLRNPPQGGCPADYVRWASMTPGVTRVYVERLWAGAGSVRVFPIFDDLFAGGIADSGHLAAVAAGLAPLQPSDAAVTVALPVATTINVVIANLLPASAAVRAAVAAELADTFRRLGQVAGGDTPIPGMTMLATPFTFSASWIWQAVANASGEQRHQLTAPSADVTIAAGHLPVLGTVTFT
jgi:uncharacterized phage protein gp47/JayE